MINSAMEKSTDPRVKHMPRSWSQQSEPNVDRGKQSSWGCRVGRLTAGLAELCRKPGTKAGRRRKDETDNQAIADCLHGEEPGLEEPWSASTLNRCEKFYFSSEVCN